MHLNRYLQRIRFEGPVRPDLSTLQALHRAHLLAIAYENLDIHLGRALLLDSEAVFAKIVDGNRGGWCYEMNGLFASVLREIGFDVTLLASAVDRVPEGNDGDFDHLILRVRCDDQPEQPWLVDVGFGNGFFEPLPLVAGTHAQRGFTYRLTHRDDVHGHDVHGHDEWFFHNDHRVGDGFGFLDCPRQIDDFASRCTWLQSEPTSPFVVRTSCHRFTPVGVVGLRGAVLKTITPERASDIVINSRIDYARVLRHTFGLSLTDHEIDTLWSRVWPAHLAWVASTRDAISSA